MKVIILAAGYGTRLYPLTINKPKPLLEVAGKTILERLIEKVDTLDFCEAVYIVTNGKFHERVNDWILKHAFTVKCEVINDKTFSNDDRLGAIGDINLVIGDKAINDDLLIMAGDNLFEFNILKFINFARDKDNLTVALYDVKDRDMAKNYGIVALDKKNNITDFCEKPENPPSTLASTGIYYLKTAGIKAFREYMKTANTKDAPGNFVKWVSEKHGASGYVFTEGWYDIGSKVSLEKAIDEYVEKGL